MKLPRERVWNARTNTYEEPVIETVRKAYISPEGKIVTAFVPVDEVLLKDPDKKDFDITEMPTRVFVYGTLKEGHYNHERHLGTDRDGKKIATYLGQAEVAGFLLKHLGAFPAAIQTSNKDWKITGEVYLTKMGHLLRGLDRLEGYPHLYNRQLVETSYGPAWIYFQSRSMLKTGDDFIPSGIWLGGTTPCFMWPATVGDGDRIGDSKFLISSPRSSPLDPRNRPLAPVVPLPAPQQPPSPPVKAAVNHPVKAKGPWTHRADTANEGKANIGPVFEEAG